MEHLRGCGTAQLHHRPSTSSGSVCSLGFKLAIVQLRGADLLRGLEFGVAAIEQDDEFLVQVSGMLYAYDSSRPSMSGRVRVSKVRVGREPLDTTATYTITTSEGIANLLRAVGVTPASVQLLETHEFSVVESYIRQLGNVQYSSEGRIMDVSMPHGSE